MQFPNSRRNSCPSESDGRGFLLADVVDADGIGRFRHDKKLVVEGLSVSEQGKTPVLAGRSARSLHRATLAGRQIEVGYPSHIGIVRLDPSQAKFLPGGILAVHDTHSETRRGAWRRPAWR
mgnify:CR=1 FL=1